MEKPMRNLKYLILVLLMSCASSHVTTVLDNKQGELRVHPKGAKVRVFTDRGFSKKIKLFMAELTLPPGGKVPRHRDGSDEYLYVVQGAGNIWINGTKYKIKRGSFVYMPKMSVVKFESTSKQKVKVFQVFAPAGPEQKYNSWVEKN
jgi:mannose-6-phosphate isomerase-like protein (cupin superfamily)